MRTKIEITPEATERVSNRLSLILAASLPLLAIFLAHQFNENSSTAKDHKLANLSKAGEDTRLIEFCSKNIKPDRAFVLFQHGTCVVIDNQKSSEAIKDEALKILLKTATPDARFVCTPVEENNLIVSYTEPVFHIRFSEDMKLHRNAIETDFRRFLTKDELADISEHWEPPFHAKVGLRSRARLIKDAADPLVSRIIAPRGTKKTSTEQTASVSF